MNGNKDPMAVTELQGQGAKLVIEAKRQEGRGKLGATNCSQKGGRREPWRTADNKGEDVEKGVQASMWIKAMEQTV